MSLSQVFDDHIQPILLFIYNISWMYQIGWESAPKSFISQALVFCIHSLGPVLACIQFYINDLGVFIYTHTVIPNQSIICQIFILSVAEILSPNLGHISLHDLWPSSLDGRTLKGIPEIVSPLFPPPSVLTTVCRPLCILCCSVLLPSCVV